MRLPLTFLLPVLLLLCACGSDEAPERATAAPAQIPGEQITRKPPSPEGAARIVSESAEFSDFQSPYSAWTLPTKGSMVKGPALEAARDLEAAGWITLDAENNVTLTSKANEDRRFLARESGFVDIVPLAKKELVEVSEVRMRDDGKPAVHFTWRWIPNDVGTVLQGSPFKERYTGDKRASAILMPVEGDGWEVLLIEPVGDESVPGAAATP